MDKNDSKTRWYNTPKSTLRVALKRLTLSVITGRHPNGLRYAHIFDGIKKPRKWAVLTYKIFT